jgi:3-deoxy-manno-octulosonate cytidylyltransferase (CMP-KDO synthetase)
VAGPVGEGAGAKTRRYLVVTFGQTFTHMVSRLKVIGNIPARYKSTRLEGKPLADIHGRSMIEHVYRRAQMAASLSRVIVATDDRRIEQAVINFGGEVTMTRPEHACGTERVAEVVASLDADIVVNIQGDEPLLDPLMIDECADALQIASDVGISTVAKKIGEKSFHDPAVVKVVLNLKGQALYFSRSLLPYPRYRTDDFAVFEHIGLYAYRKDALLQFAALPQTPLEKIEGLEQLRALENGISIQVVETASRAEIVSVDTQEDLQRVREILAAEATD